MKPKHQPIKVFACVLRDDVSGQTSIGLGRTHDDSLTDAITNADKPPEIVRGLIKRQICRATYYGRTL